MYDPKSHYADKYLDCGKSVEDARRIIADFGYEDGYIVSVEDGEHHAYGPRTNTDAAVQEIEAYWCKYTGGSPDDVEAIVKSVLAWGFGYG